MPDHPEKGSVLEVTCPCCEARLTVDPAAAPCSEAKRPPMRARGRSEGRAAVLEQETARIHERYDQIVRTERAGARCGQAVQESHREIEGTNRRPPHPGHRPGLTASTRNYGNVSGRQHGRRKQQEGPAESPSEAAAAEG